MTGHALIATSSPPASAARRRALRRLAAAACAPVQAVAAAQPVGAPLPPELRQRLPGAALQGETRFRWFGVHVYDARLWSATTVMSDRYAERPFALELEYARALEGLAIAERSIDEIERQGTLAPPQRERWLAAMRDAFPDVRNGTRLTGLHRPDTGASFFHDGRPTREVLEPEFSRRFFGIWLSDRSSHPALRRALLGQP